MRKLIIVTSVFVAAFTMNHITHAQETAPSAGVVEEVSTAKRTVTISGRVFAYNSGTLMVNDLALSKSNRTIRQFTPGTNVQVEFTDSEPLATLKVLQMIQP